MKNGYTVLRKQKTIEVEVELSGSHIAELFHDLSMDEQAEFFNQLGSYKKFANEIEHVYHSRKLTIDGKYAMWVVSDTGN